MQDLPKTCKIGFVLLPEFSNMGLATAIEPLFVANWLTGKTLFEWTILSRDGLSVKASNGMTVPVAAAIGDAQAFDIILVVASFSAMTHAKDESVLNWLRRAARFGVTLGGIETGSEVLAAAGLLDGHVVAIHWYNFDGFSAQYPKVSTVNKAFSFGPGRISCGCGTSSLDMMLNLVAVRVNSDLATEVAQHLIAQNGENYTSAVEPQYPEALNRSKLLVKAAVQIMQDTLENPLPCSAIAARLKLSGRQLQRHFNAHLGVGIRHHNLYIRLERAHQYIQQTDLSITEIAIACGFGSPEHFSRLYRRNFGVAPSKDRQQDTAATVFRLRTRHS
jgi:AraC family transcriptional regulator, carnitine catabolism transcriptional activator